MGRDSVLNAPRDVAPVQTPDAPPPLHSGLLPKPKQAGDRRTRSPSAACHLRPERAPTADRSSRPGLLGLPVPERVGMEGAPGHRSARNRGPLAPQGFQALLAIDLEARTRTPFNLTRDSGVCFLFPSDGPKVVSTS